MQRSTLWRPWLTFGICGVSLLGIPYHDGVMRRKKRLIWVDFGFLRHDNVTV